MSKYRTVLETIRTAALVAIAVALLDPCTGPSERADEEISEKRGQS